MRSKQIFILFSLMHMLHYPQNKDIVLPEISKYLTLKATNCEELQLQRRNKGLVYCLGCIEHSPRCLLYWRGTNSWSLKWSRRWQSYIVMEVPWASFDMDDCPRQKLKFKSSDKQSLQHSRFNCSKLEEKERIWQVLQLLLSAAQKQFHFFLTKIWHMDLISENFYLIRRKKKKGKKFGIRKIGIFLLTLPTTNIEHTDFNSRLTWVLSWTANFFSLTIQYNWPSTKICSTYKSQDKTSS